jgi:ribosomal protein S18 acetylase RimI-like enzyme
MSSEREAVTFQDILIERAEPGDVDGIIKLAEDNYADRGGTLTGRLVREAVAETIQILPGIVARRDGKIIGFLLTWEKALSKHPCVRAMLEAYPGSPDAYVYGPVCVDASARGCGVAGAMFEELSRLLPGREGILFIRESNDASIRAHRKMGMQTTRKFMYEGARFLVLSYRAGGDPYWGQSP